MNHVYRVVFNRSLGVYQCVSEIAKSRGKSSGKSQISSKSQTAARLLLAPLTMAMLCASGSAMAVTYDNGQTTTVTDESYFVTDDTVTGSGTVLNANNLFFSNQAPVSKMIVSSGAIVNASKTTALTNDASLNIDAATFNSKQLGVGFDGKGTVTASNGANVKVSEFTSIGDGNHNNGTGIFNITGTGSALDSALIDIGKKGSGELNLTDKATLQSDSILLGREASGNGKLSLDGIGTQATVNNNLVVGEAGKGNILVKKAAKLEVAGGIAVGNTANSVDNSIDVLGQGSQLNVGGLLQVGDSGQGTLNVKDGAVVEAGSTINFGRQKGSQGVANVSGAGSQLKTLNDTVLVGMSGEGKLAVSDGGSVKSKFLYIARDTGSTGQMTVSGNTTKIDTSELAVGFDGNGELAVTNQAVANTDELFIGYGEGSTGKTIINQQGVINVVNNAGVGVSGSGDLKLTNNSTLNVDGNLLTGNKATSKGNTITVGAKGEGTDKASKVNVKEQIQIGDLTDGTLNVANGHVHSQGNFIIGHKSGSQGNVVVDGEVSHISTEGGMAIGLSGTGTLDVKNGGRVSTAGMMVVGDAISGVGTVNFDGGGTLDSNSITANQLIVGGKGKGSMTIKDTYDPVDTSWVYGLEVVQDTIIGDDASGVGELIFDSTLASMGNLIVGNKGSGTLKVINNTGLDVSNISRGSDSVLSDVYFDNAYITVTKDQPNFFANFTDKQAIKIGSNGLIFDVSENNVNINPNAVLTGNVGVVDWENVKGGFAKVGTGTLEMSANSKQWTGETLITEGTLKVNGDYILKEGDSLGIALDVEEEGSLDSYGKLVVNGNADISKGELKVYASEAIQKLSGTNEWKDVVKATTRTGKFANVTDNSPLVSFVPDYSDADAVHLKMVAPTDPKPTDPKPTDPKPTDPKPTDPKPPVIDTTFVDAVNSQSNKSALNLAQVLDQAIQDRVTSGSNVLADQLIGDTMNFTQAQVNESTNQLQPLFMGGANRIITDTNYAASKAIAEHSQTTPQRNLWAKAIGNDSTHDAEGNVTGYNSESYGAIVGMDTPVNPNLNLGVAVSYIQNDADTDGHRIDHELKAKNWQILGYGNYAASPATNVNFHAGAGRSDIKGERHIGLRTSATASSDYSADTLQAGFGLTHRIGDERQNITPFASMDYARATSDSYRETGAGVYNLNVDENTYESMRWTAGLRLSQPLTPTLALTGQLAGAIENGDKQSDITASFAGMPNAKFNTIGQEVGREIGIAGIGLSYTPTANTTISANYLGEWRDNYQDQGAAIIFKTTF